MKSILILLMAMPLFVMAQSRETFTVTELKLPNSITCSFQGVIIDGDTTYTLDISFQNMEYAHISDIASIYFMHETDKQKFTQDLQDLLNKEVAKGGSASVENKISKQMSYSIYKTDYGKGLTIFNKDTKYFMLSAKNVQKLIDWLKTFTIPEG